MRTKKTKLPKTPVNKTHAKTPVAAANPPMVLKEITIAEARSLSKEPDVMVMWRPKISLPEHLQYCMTPSVTA